MKTTSRAYQALGAPLEAFTLLLEESGAPTAKEESIGPVEANCAMLSLPASTAPQPPQPHGNNAGHNSADVHDCMHMDMPGDTAEPAPLQVANRLKTTTLGRNSK
ncbi:hypothetical protein [Pseudomonas sp. PD9R]|uniref:hypothetical protein n=1 Tax=Pseudomonas sp. PD9R TaxID=2853534 RepID=UPI001C482252|nr:hypothetical protein [Pseudomonas sp. PD9R]MBV6822150.1 hypothetical protein [Pseudomonas sp. PD9R]